MSVKIVYSGYNIPIELLIQLICHIITSHFNLLLSFLFCLFLSTSVSWFMISYHGYNKVELLFKVLCKLNQSMFISFTKSPGKQELL